jgi:coatomer protein complex subunit epsilon
VHIYLSINRPDLAKKEYDAAKRFADDSLLIQLVEASIGVTVGGSALNSAYHIYDEQASAPGASSNPSVIASRGVAHLLRAHHSEAEGDFSEALKTDETHADALVGSLVVADLGGKKLEAEGILRYGFSHSPS